MPHVLVGQVLHAAATAAVVVVRDPHRHPDPVPLVGAEAVLLHHALDELLHRQFAQEDGPVVDFGFGRAHVDAQGCEENTERVSHVEFLFKGGGVGSVLGSGGGEGEGARMLVAFLPGALLGDGVRARW